MNKRTQNSRHLLKFLAFSEVVGSIFIIPGYFTISVRWTTVAIRADVRHGTVCNAHYALRICRHCASRSIIC
jgi:hypothetical protein